MGKRAPPPPPPLASKPKPKPALQYCTASYDYEAQAEGDLSFSAGDRIEIVTKTDSTSDWWTGRLDGREGSFPANYVSLQ
jgi:amphiphysin